MLAIKLFPDVYGRDRFFKKSFLLMNIKIEIILSISIFLISNINTWFTKKELKFKNNIIINVLLSKTKIELIDWKKVIIAALSLEKRIFILYIIVIKSLYIIYTFWIDMNYLFTCKWAWNKNSTEILRPQKNRFNLGDLKRIEK